MAGGGPKDHRHAEGSHCRYSREMQQYSTVQQQAGAEILLASACTVFVVVSGRVQTAHFLVQIVKWQNNDDTKRAADYSSALRTACSSIGLVAKATCIMHSLFVILLCALSFRRQDRVGFYL